MSELVSSIELKKADGKPIKFNFQFENGLPVKPILKTDFKVGKNKKSNQIKIFVIISENISFNNLLIKNITYHDNLEAPKSKDIFFHFDDFYIVYYGMEENLLKSCLSNNTIVGFYDNNSNPLLTIDIS